MSCSLLMAWVVVLALAGVGIVRGAKRLGTASPKGRTYAVVLMLLSGSIPLCCFFGPSQVVRLTRGNYPLGHYPSGKITTGMSKDEVAAILGTPHERHARDGEEHWYYWIDSFGIY